MHSKASRWLRRVLIGFAFLFIAAVFVVTGLVWGVKFADARWTDDVNRLGNAMRRLDQDINAGRVASLDADYFVALTEMPLERFDDKSVTYYVGPGARHSATIEFDKSGVKGVSLR